MYTAVAKVSKFSKKGDSVVILGAGGGLGHLGVQIAKSSGYRVIAVDSGDKEEICKRCGASEFVNFQKEDVRDSSLLGIPVAANRRSCRSRSELRKSRMR